MIERLEIISAVTMKNRKFKQKAEERLAKLEAAQLLNVQKEEFQREMDMAEARITEYTRDTLTRF